MGVTSPRLYREQWAVAVLSCSRPPTLFMSTSGLCDPRAPSSRVPPATHLTGEALARVGDAEGTVDEGLHLRL